MTTYAQKYDVEKKRRENAETQLSLALQRVDTQAWTIRRLEKERDALESKFNAKASALGESEERYRSLANSYDWYTNRANTLTKELADARNQLQLKINELLKAKDLPVERRQLEGLSRPRLVSLIEEAINEARRKGLVEAEGLLSRHRELTDTTDLEMMRGVVKTYQDRIKVVEERQAAEAAKKAPVKLDTEPLKLDFGGSALFNRPLASTYRSNNDGTWWDNSATVVAPPPKPANKPSSFSELDALANEYARNQRAREFVDGKRTTVAGSKGGTYILSRTGNVYRCSCPAWTFSTKAAEQRSCKHLVNYFGKSFEDARIAKAVANPVPVNPAAIKCWCGETTVRGQCPKHTRDWKGDEFCTCGRKFSACRAAFDTLSVAQRRIGHQPKLRGW